MATQDQYPQRYVIGGQCRNESGAYVQTITLTTQRDTTDNGRFYDGRWYREERDGENRREIVNTSSFGEKVFFRFRFKGKVEGFGAPESTVIIQNTNQIRVQMFEYDPTIFDGDELIGDTEPEQRNGTEIHPRNQLRVRRITIGSRRNPDPNPDPLLEVEVDLNDTCFVRGEDSGESEFYCKISAPVNNGRTLEKELPEDTHYYLKVRYHFEYVTIRVQVLDCRSGRPIANARVKKIVVDSGSGSRKHEFFFKPDSSRIAGNGYTVNNIKTALNGYYNNEACGNGHRKYSCNQQTSSFNDAEKGMYTNFLKDRWYFFDAAHPNAENNGPIPALRANENEPPLLMRQYVVDEYNGMCSTDENGFLLIRVPLNKYLRDMGRNRGLELKLAIRFWDVPVFVERLNSGSSSNTIRRDNFYLVASGAPESGTGFNIKWPVIIQGNGQRNLTAEANQQSNEDNRGFGWRAVKGTGSSANEVEFRTSLELRINTDKYNFENFDFESITHCRDDFSTFYRDEDLRPFGSVNLKDPHFVLFAMQWCQPVWDGIDDPDGDNRTNNSVFVNRKDSRDRWIKDLYMHIATMYISGQSLNPYGHYYGFFDNVGPMHRPQAHGHGGIDLYSGLNGNTHVFASHGGWVTSGTVQTIEGSYITLYIERNNARPYISHFHLQGPSSFNGKHVLCGQILTNTGRSGFDTLDNGIYPSHLHFQVMGSNGIIEPNLIINDSINQRIFPSNMLPLKLPCACTWSENYSYPRNCNFSNLEIIYYCWAVQEFPYDDVTMTRSSNNNPEQHQSPVQDASGTKHFICPYLFRSGGNRSAQLQAQLKFIFSNQGKSGIPINSNFKDINTSSHNGINGRILNGNAIGNVKTKDAVIGFINAYQEINGATPSATNGQALAFVQLVINNTVTTDSTVRGAVEWINRLKPIT